VQPCLLSGGRRLSEGHGLMELSGPIQLRPRSSSPGTSRLLHFIQAGKHGSNLLHITCKLGTLKCVIKMAVFLVVTPCSLV
jgi:hypothetical protein